jgi:Protein of unknown function (DUF3644).
MKARSRQLVDRAIAATVAAIEIYNKPDFQYRNETFAVLAVNGWELLLKAKWLIDRKNDIRSLYVVHPHKKKDGTLSKRAKIKVTRSGNPFTHGIDFLAKRLVQQKRLDEKVWNNIEVLLEIRDSAVHFYNQSPALALRLYEVGAASVKNFVAVLDDWFERDLSEFNLYLLPLSFGGAPQRSDALLNAEEQKFLSYLAGIQPKSADPTSRFSVAVNVEVKFVRSKSREAIPVVITKDKKATAIQLSEEQIREKYPWDYNRLTAECKKRYSGFKVVDQYHDLRKKLLIDPKFGTIRYLDPGNPKSSKKAFFDPNIMAELDRHYARK